MTLLTVRSACPRRARARVGGAAVVVVVVALGLAGCGASGGESDGGATATSTTAAKATTSTSTTSTTVAPSTTSTTPPTTAPPTTRPPATTPTTAGGTTNGGGGGANVPLTADQAAAKVKATGDWDVDMGTYDPRARLTAVLARAAGAASSAAPEQVYLFSNGQYLGPATKTERTAISIDASSGQQVVVSYGHYAKGDPNCCPSQPRWVVTFTISGTGKLLVSGDLPPEGQGQF